VESNERFVLADFYVEIGAERKEEHALRQDLVRGLKDYYETAYGYDKYGAETILLLPERMHQPYIYGFALLRILHDRRISSATKVGAAQHALQVLDYGADGGMPYGLFAALHVLAENGRLSIGDLRYALVVSASDSDPFRGIDRAWMLRFFRWLVANGDVPAAERLFWAHSIIARHSEQSGAAKLIDVLMAGEETPLENRRELCQAWVHFRQPRLLVVEPDTDDTPRGALVGEHMRFWVAHAPSWPSSVMVRLGIVWLARLGENVFELLQTYIGYADTYAEQVHGAVVQVLTEHHGSLSEAQVKSVIEQGLRLTGSSPTRRKFYRLGADLYGVEYLERANIDTAGSVRQWAARQKQKLS